MGRIDGIDSKSEAAGKGCGEIAKNVIRDLSALPLDALLRQLRAHSRLQPLYRQLQFSVGGRAVEVEQDSSLVHGVRPSGKRESGGTQQEPDQNQGKDDPFLSRWRPSCGCLYRGALKLLKPDHHQGAVVRRGPEPAKAATRLMILSHNSAGVAPSECEIISLTRSSPNSSSFSFAASFTPSE